MKYAIVENNKVINIVVSDKPFENNWIQSEVVDIGDTYENGEFIKPATVVIPLDYRTQRAAAYPPITDYIDGIVKGDTTQVQAYIDVCLAVKAKYPKLE